ncbi:MAG TPA: secretin N-terminal domain-containing protein [bacterium]|nr:secretin N-terminal domain-containing protein [bacterium]HPP87020.1 secretin N-terminal domain-containing protein [bacterium]
MRYFIYFFAIFTFLFFLEKPAIYSNEKSNANDSANLIALDFDNIEIKDLIIKLNEITKINYILPPNISGKVSIITPEKISVAALPDIIENVLNIAGFGIVYRNNFAVITPLGVARQEISNISEGDEIDNSAKITVRLYKLKYASANAVLNALRQIMPVDVRIVVDNLTNSLIFAGLGELIKKFEDLIKLLDVESIENKILIYKMNKISVQTLAPKLTQILTALNAQRGYNMPCTIIPEEYGNKLIIITVPSNIKYIEDLLENLDNKAGMPTDIRVFHLTNTTVKKLSENIINIIKVNPVFSNSLNSLFLYEDLEQNALIVFTANSEIFGIIEDFIKKIDVKAPFKKPVIKVFPLIYADAEIAVENLKKLLPLTDPVYNEKFKLTNIVADKRQQSIIVSSNYQDIIDYIGELLAEFDKEANIKKSNIHIYKLQNANAQAVAEALSKLTFPDNKTGANTAIPFTFDRATNSVVATCSNEQFVQIKKIIEDFDKEKPQILITAIIAEVSAEDLEKLGVEWQAGDKISSGKFEGAMTQNFNMIDPNILKNSDLKTASKLLPGFSVGVIKSDNLDVGAIINIFKQNTDFNILSSPRILTEDNNEAFINVGEKVPFITNSRVTDNNATIYSYEYQDVGITLRITPQVNNQNRITLDIKQEVKNLLEKAVFDAPLVSTRELKTKITVDNKKVIVIGGLIKDNKSKTKYAVPLLSQIPVLGRLFQRTEEKSSKTNLIVVLSPEVIYSVNSQTIEIQQTEIEKINKRIDETLRKLKDDK